LAVAGAQQGRSEKERISECGLSAGEVVQKCSVNGEYNRVMGLRRICHDRCVLDRTGACLVAGGQFDRKAIVANGLFTVSTGYCAIR